MNKASLLKQLHGFSEKQMNLIHQLGKLPLHQLTRKSAEHPWSILDIIEHLVLAEKYVFKGFPDPDTLTPQKRGLKHRLLHTLVIVILKSRWLKVQVPAKAMNPSGEQSFEALTHQWQNQQEWLFSFIQGLDPIALNAAVFFHPVSGPITPKQAIFMLQIHFDKHEHQIQRMLNSS